MKKLIFKNVLEIMLCISTIVISFWIWQKIDLSYYKHIADSYIETINNK